MKRLLIVVSSVMAMSLFGANNDPVVPRQDAKDPTGKYADYGGAMAHEEGSPMAAEWHDAQGATLAENVDDDVLATFVADETAASALLSLVKGAYDTDPLVATQVAAVSQWVMREEPCWLCFWKPSPAKGRKIWVSALVTRAENTDDAYVQLFCLDQLRWCGCKCPCILACIEAIQSKSNDKHVKEMANIVLRTLK